MKKSIVFFCFFVVMLNFSCAQNTKNKVTTPKNVPFVAELFVDQLQIPWGFTFLPDNSMLITEKSGEIIHFYNGKIFIMEKRQQYLMFLKFIKEVKAGY